MTTPTVTETVIAPHGCKRETPSVSIGARTVGVSPTVRGLLRIADIFAACRIGHTVHNTNGRS